MALDAGEVYVVVGAKLDSSSIARANAAQRSLLNSANDYQKAIKRGEEASNKLHASNQRWQHAAVIGAKASAIGIGTVVAALGGAAVAAASFEASMRNVNSIAQLSEKQFKGLEGQVLRLSTAVGKSPKDLADGLYSIVSSGFKAKDAMVILGAGAKAARAGLTDTATATTALTSVLNAYGLKANDSRKVSDVLFQTVNTGVLNFEQLAGSLGKVLSPAAAIGVSFKELSGALAALTLRGNSADEASTQLGQTMVALQKPGPALTSILKGLGYESGTAAIHAIGFKKTLDEVAKAADKAHVPLAKVFVNARALRGVQGLEGTAHAAQVFTSSVKAMDEATKGAGATQQVFLEQQKSTAAQFDKLKAGIDVAAITIGTALLPAINQGIGALTKWFAAAQKSGDLTRWAHEIATDVNLVVGFLKSLGPAASTAFHVVSSTIQAAIPFVRELYKIFQTLEPAIADVAHAGAGLGKALGPGPILAAVAAFALLRRATLTGQAAMGTFATVMKAGEKAIGTSGGGIALQGGRFNKVGSEAIGASSKVKIAAAGIASSFGPQLIALGVAGIIGGILAIRASMTNLKDEANDAANALLHLNDVRLNRVSAALDVRASQIAVEKARASAGSAAAQVAAARAIAPSGHPNIADPGVTAALSRQRDVILSLQQAENRLAESQTRLGHANSELRKGSQDLARQFGGLSSKAQEATTKVVALSAHSVVAIPASAAKQANAWADAFTRAARNADGATSASIKTALGVAGLVRQMGRIPDAKTTKLIVDDLKAGRSVAQIREQLIKVGLLKPTPRVDANTQPANTKLDVTKGKADALNAAHPVVHLGSSGFDAVESAISRINTNILHLTSTPFTVNVHYATSGTPPTGGSSKVNRKAVGFKTQGPEVIQVGEDGQEYVIPTTGKYRTGGIALWMQAGHDLGIPGYARGKSPKPGRTPPPIQHGLGYDPSALDAQMGAEKTRLDDARSYRDTISGRIKTDSDHLHTLQGELETAKKGTSSKNPKTATAARIRVSRLNAEIAKTQAKINGERDAHRHQVDAVIPTDTKRYQAATAAARIGNEHADKITLWQARADSDTSAMQLASDQWDEADRKKNPAGKVRAYKEWDTARKARIGDLAHVRDLLKEVRAVVGKTKYGADIAGQLATAIGAIVQAGDDTAAPGYEAPDTAPASTNLDDYLNPWEITAQQQIAYAAALASTTDDTSDDVSAAQNAFGVAQEIADRLTREGAPIDVLTQAVQAVATAKGDLESAVQGNTATAGTPSVTADQQAALDQANRRATDAQAMSASDRSALDTFGKSLDLILGGNASPTVIQNFSMLTPGSASQQRQIGTEVVKAFGAQPNVPSTTGFYNG